ncbi:hypothetical protein [Cellulomonas sp. RIT-PI-Y]|uniref:hypothetical protein n=1 Tax=Cellulomonas sp. RIT-PI-Y TaxID=3035297 RepID=UPI0021D86855|nr:hypothetical protein [Cellulomonas sp. RIT-PI-Y]
MASPASPPIPRPSPRFGSKGLAPDTWPIQPSQRWLLRLTLAFPFALVALLTQGSGFVPTANRALSARGDLIQWGDTSLGWMAEIFPPLSAALSSIVGGSDLALNLVAAVVLGFVLQRLAGVLARRGVGLWGTAAVLGTLVLTPPLYYLAASDLQSLLGLALVVVALDGIASFVEEQNTEAGFRAGISLGVAVMVDPGAWFYAIVLGALAPFFASRAGQRGRASNRATITVLIFPAVGAIAFWLYASWWFSSDPWGGLESTASQGWFPIGADAAAALIAQGMLAVPLFLVAFGFRLVRDRWSLIAPIIAIAGLYLSLWAGLRQAGGQTYVLLTALYVLLLVARRPSRTRRRIILASALLQIALGWGILLLIADSPIYDWLRVVTGL